MLRKFCKGFLALTVLLVGWIAINSIDEAPRYDQSLLLPPVEVPDGQNGYALLRYLNTDYDKDVLLSKEDAQKLRNIINGLEWSSEFAERILKDHADVIEKVRQVVERPIFKLDTPENNYSYVVHGRLFDIVRIILLKARLYEDSGDVDSAIDSADLALRFCEKIRSDKNGSMLSYMVGSSCDAKVMDFYHELVSNDYLSYENIKDILLSISNIYEYDNDGFNNVIRGEFTWLKIQADEQKIKSLSVRLSEYQDALSGKNGSICYSCDDAITNKIFGYMKVLMPEYYLQPNKMLNYSYDHLKRDGAMDYESRSCEKLDKSIISYESDSLSNDKKSIKDLFYPGSITDFWRDAHWNNYILRRCQYYNYFSAIKTIVVMELYRKDHGKLPESLDALVPEYIKKNPVDYLGEKSLHYSPENNWLYSEGIDHKDSGGATRGFNKGTCYNYKDMGKNQCGVKPTFAINWNDYKFYEKLNKAEDGDTDAQRVLGWMYSHGRNVSADADKAVYWLTKAADKKDAHAENLLGLLYEVKSTNCSNPGPTAAIEDDKKAFDWFRKSYEDGSLYGGANYAKYLISGKSGVNDFQQAVHILNKQAIDKEVNHDRSWFYILEKDWLSSTNGSSLVSAWADYYLQHPDLVKGFGENKVAGERYMHNLLANNLWWNSYQYNADSPEERNRLEQWSFLLREHYLAAHDDEGLKKLEDFVSNRNKLATGVVEDKINMCQIVFDHRHEDMTRFQQVQKGIFKNKDKANKLVESFRKEMANKYSASGMEDYSDTNGISLGFPAVPIKNLLVIMFDFANLASGEQDLQFDGDVYETMVMVDSFELHPGVSINLILADLGLGARCADGKVTIYVEDSTRLKSKILPGKFVVNWSGLTHKNDIFSGQGELVYSDGTKYRGEVANGLPNGKGEYLEKYGSFSGDNFVDGMLSGHGVRMSDGHPVERGEYVLNVMRTGIQGYGEGSVYETESYIDNIHSKGTITYLDVGDYKDKYYTYLPLDNVYPPLWSFTGAFEEDKKTAGTCNIFKNRAVVDTFPCEFFKDTLVKVGDVSLLPPGMTTADLQKYIP